MKFDVRRSEWQDPAKPITGPAIDWSRVDTIVIHYTAADDLIDGDPGEDPAKLPAYFRAMQAAYLADPNRGYSLGYNAGVDYRSLSWEIRGADIRCAANRGHNEHTFATLVLVDGAAPANPAQVAKIRELRVMAERLAGRPLNIAGHGQLTGAATACPGVGLRAQIAAGVFTPVPPVPPTQPTEDDDMLRQWICTDGDPAVFAVAGLDATWVKDESVRDSLALLGAGAPVSVPRQALSALILNGPAPTYGAGDTRPKTTPAHFAAHRP